MQAKTLLTFGLWWVALAVPIAVTAGERPNNSASSLHHHIRISIDPEAHLLTANDTINLPPHFLTDGRSIRFLLHGDFHVTVETPGATLGSENTHLRPSSITDSGRYQPYDPRVPVTQYRLTLPPESRIVTLRYKGHINHPPLPAGDDYGRTAEDAAGVISPDGIFLSGASYWYPTFGDELQTFTLDVDGPADFRFISQGGRRQPTTQNGRATVTWQVDAPQDEIYLVGAKWVEYERHEGPLSALALLRTPDSSLAEKYLSLTGPYVRMYEQLLGPYPYPKFALVENFWETGYGMPSFTLLGSTVLRLPFIPTSSYPHEILHNWWGNGVYVDYRGGNWCEGLTAYLADHLMAEQRGDGAIYRRTTLKRYTDYVQGAQDFPIRLFRERHNPATKAIGYGKTLMVFHMLRRQLGDEPFMAALQSLYRENRFKRTSFAVLAQTMSRMAGTDLRSFFAQWVERAGAPQLQLSDVAVERRADGYRVRGRLEQIQSGEPYRLTIPVTLYLEGREDPQAREVSMESHDQEFAFDVPQRPLRLDVDPDFDVFRRLHRAEIPPSLSEAFGAPRTLFVLPSDESPQVLDGYRRLAASWKANVPEADVRLDRDLAALPADRAVWLLGWRNRFRPDLEAALKGQSLTIGETDFTIAATRMPKTTGSLVVIGRQPGEPANSIGLIATENPTAIPGLSRKVPHYDRYGYLAFTGDEPKNVEKGEWPILSSPLAVELGFSHAARQAVRPTRRPLITLEP